MDRRTVLGVLCLVAAPLTAEAQPTTKIPRVVVLMPGSPQGTTLDSVHAFRQGLQDLGYLTGQTVVLEERWNPERTAGWSALVAEVLRAQVDVFVSGSGAATEAARRVSPTVPLVSPTLTDPVESGYAASLSRPGGNVTGLTLLTPELTAKRLELLKEVAPGVSRIAVLEQPRTTAARRRETEVAAQRLGLIVIREIVKDGVEIDRAVERAARIRVQAVVLTQAALFAENGARIAALALRHRLPTISGETGYAKAGGLVEYAPNIPENFRRAATYVDKILKGTRPGDLPIEQPTRVALTINLKTAKALGLTIPQSVLLRADELIE